jgi:hypothetical protein
MLKVDGVVWVAIGECSYETRDVIGVFSTKEKAAESCAMKEKEDNVWADDWYHLEAYQVDGQLVEQAQRKRWATEWDPIGVSLPPRRRG